MQEAHWGMCKHCQFFQIEPGVTVANETTGQCAQESLQQFMFRVSGNSGCNLFQSGKPVGVRGASSIPESNPVTH